MFFMRQKWSKSNPAFADVVLINTKVVGTVFWIVIAIQKHIIVELCEVIGGWQHFYREIVVVTW